MPSFQWDPCFVTGLPTVDEQHRGLVDLINAFGDLLVDPQGASDAETGGLLDELAEYARHHFADEEKLMARAGLDPRCRRAHRGEHAAFLAELPRLREAAEHGGAGSAKLLLHFLTDWLAYHILGSDLVLARQIAAIEAGASAGAAYETVQQHRDPATAILLGSLDSLFRQVSERNRELSELNRTLEARVAERTKELSQANRRLEELALTDTLTGLANRRHAMRRLQQEWSVSHRGGCELTVIMVDADGFKGINDEFGHDAGDTVLRELARALREAVRTDDTVCRLGGDEFLVICSHTPCAGALQVAETLRAAVAGLRVPAGAGHWHGSVSVGVAERDGTMRRMEDLLEAADRALYAAKRGGRNRVCIAAACPAGCSV